jgi:predicted ATP-grasp superfamily ATP-dependent carboligase
MSQSTDRLVILSRTGRALAESAWRAGQACVVIDAFADADTRAAASQCIPVAWNGFGPEGTDYALLESANSVGLVYGGGVEAMPELLEPWFTARKLFGNAPDIVRAVNNPIPFFALLDKLAIVHPEVRFSPPSERDGWLIKRAASTGGVHVRPWSGLEEIGVGDYFQRRVNGPVMSILFLADGERPQVVGWNTQWTRPGDYLWGGAINHAGLTRSQQEVLLAHVSSLVCGLQLRGLNSLDFVLDGDVPKILELNPRPGATLDLYDEDFHDGLLYWHLQSCAGRLPRPADRHSAVKRACKVIYAGQTVAIPENVDWPAWCHDLPSAGVIFGAGEPVCTVTASGDDPAATLRRLEQRVTITERQLSSFRQAA